MNSSVLPTGKFLWEKNGVSEVAPRPSEFTFSLLKKIYANDGPVAQVWRRHGIKYFDTDFLRLYEGDLYIDREKELQSLFPAFSYLTNTSFKPKLTQIKGLFRTIRNAFSLLSLSTKNPKPIREKLFLTLDKKFEKFENFDQGLKDFLLDYEIVFETNLFAEAALSSLRAVIDNEPLNLVEVLNVESGAALKETENRPPPQDILSGNSLEITDISPFVAGRPLLKRGKTSVEVFKTIPAWKHPLLIKRICLAQEGERLREYGRWIMLRHINRLRPLVKTGVPKPAVRLLPIRLSHLNNTEKIKKKTLGVSAGQARGVLVNRELILKTPRPRILYSPSLTPDMVQYLSLVNGIISEQGNLLSHSAIVAREQGVPVVVNFVLVDSGLVFGDCLEIDGTTGEWKKV